MQSSARFRAVDQLLMLAGVALLDAAWRLEHSGYKKNKGK